MVEKAVGAQLRWGGQGEKWPGATLKTNPQALQPQRLFLSGLESCVCVYVCVRILFVLSNSIFLCYGIDIFPWTENHFLKPSYT